MDQPPDPPHHDHARDDHPRDDHRRDDHPRADRGPGHPGRPIWIAWTLAFVGGVAVIAAVAVALWHPCLQDGRTLATAGCAATSAPGWVLGLTTAGTLLAVSGGLTATVLTLRRRNR